MDNYVPPYDITEEMLELTSEIMEILGEFNSVNDLDKLPRLRRVSRIKSIHSSLAIENNTLTLQQVTDVIEGKRVLGPEDDILAVKNAFNVYKTLDNINPFSLKDLTKAHGIIMNGLVEEVGQIRTSPVGVINQDGKVIHIAPPANMVNNLINQLHLNKMKRKLIAYYLVLFIVFMNNVMKNQPWSQNSKNLPF